MASKQPIEMESTPVSVVADDSENGSPVDGTKSSADDSINMRRMGRRQELVRHFRMLSGDWSL